MDTSVVGPAATEKWTRRSLIAGLCLGLLVVQANKADAQQSAAYGEWRSYASDKANTKYTPLEQIDRDNVSKLRVLWRRPGVDPELTETFPDLSPSNDLRATPLMLGGVLYTSNSVGLVEALDPGTGETLWIQEPIHEGFQGVAGRSTRGVAHWSSGSNQRVFSVQGDYLVSMSAETGSLDRDFGDGGKVDLTRDAGTTAYFPAGGTSGPIVVADVVIVGGGGGDDFPVRKEGASEDIRGYDVRTGRLRWTFHVVPRPGEFGSETWEDDSWKLGGAIGAWPPLTVDEELGYLYLPLSSPAHAFYGGHRPGQNLYGNSLVCLDARTGERVWHYQLVHHDLWDYDLASAPVLGDITVGNPHQGGDADHQARLFVFDRVTRCGRLKSGSTSRGRRRGTQPFPTKPAAFDRQGLTVDDLIFHAGAAGGGARDRQALRARADGHHRWRPRDTPGVRSRFPVRRVAGTERWGVRPRDGDLLCRLAHAPVAERSRQAPRTVRSDDAVHARASGGTACCLQFEIYVPLVKPPYRITARTRVDGPQRRRTAQSPALATPERPRWDSRAGRRLFSRALHRSLISSTPRGGGGNKFRAYDKATGRVGDRAGGGHHRSADELPVERQAVHRGGHSGEDYSAEWVALGLP